MTNDTSPNIKDASLQTEGGAVIIGPVNTQGGDVVGRDQIIFTEEAAYKVRGQANPYLGLRAYTYEERLRYAGRSDVIAQTLGLLTAAHPRPVMLFVTGASGCGKSSFAQAGLLPALEQHYTATRYPVDKAVFHPSQQPLARLGEALQKLGLAVEEGPFAPVTQHLDLKSTYQAPVDQISLLVIDQFEELFTQSLPEQRDAMLELLASLPSFAELRMHIIATLRADYLPDIFEYEAIYNVAKAGVDLRAMTPDQLKIAIMQPLLHLYPQQGIRFEDELLNKLAQDAAMDPTYLPLLQVTLEDLWQGGELRLSRYYDLATAIQNRAEEVLIVKHENPASVTERSEDEQAAIMAIFLDLVEVSLEDNAHGDVRKRRRIDALVEEHPARKPLVYELTNRRLLATAVEVDPTTQERVEVVDIIHESLLRNWPRLYSAIGEHRNLLQRRYRFEIALREWQAAKTKADYLLQGVRLAEARELAEAGDVALQDDENARIFLKESLDQEAKLRRRQRNLAIAVIAILASLLFVAIANARIARDGQQQAEQAKATAQAESTRAVNASNMAQAHAVRELQERIIAETEAKRARSGELAALAISELETDPELSILLALEAISTTQTSQAEKALRRAIQASDVLTTLHHSAPVSALAFSPDGAQLITSDNQTLRLWDMATFHEVDSWDVHQAYTSKIAYHPGGTQLATANVKLGQANELVDMVVRLWDPATGAILHTLSDHTNNIQDIEYNVDGSWLASASLDGTARIWDTSTGTQVISFTLPTQVWSVAFSPDDNYLATATSDGIARIWDPVNGRVVVSYTTPMPLTSIAFSPDGKLLATAGQDRVIRLWSREDTERRRATIVGHTDTVYDINFSADGKRLLSGGLEGTAIIWDVSNLDAGVSEIKRLKGHKGYIIGIAYTPNGTVVATGGGDRVVKIWSAAAHHDLIHSVAFDPQQPEQIVTASFDHTARIWRFQDGRLTLVRTLPHADQVYRAVYSPDGRTIATASSDGTAHLWEAQTGQSLGVLTAHSDRVTSIAFGLEGSVIGTTSRDQTARIWDTASGELLYTLSGHNAFVNDIAFSPDGAYMVTTGSSAGGNPGEIRLWGMADGQLLPGSFTGHTGDVERALFSPNGKWLATTGADRSVRFWDVATGQEVHTWNAHMDRVFGLDFDATGERVVTAGVDGRVIVWNATNGELEQLLLQEETQFYGVAFAPDGKTVLTLNATGQIDLQPLAIADLRVQAVKQLTRWWRTEECTAHLLRVQCPTPPVTALP